MGENKDYKDLVILAIAAIGISVAFLAYLLYIRDRDAREKLSLGSLNQNLSQLSSTVDIPNQTATQITYPAYDERLYRLLENQQNQLENINSNINSLKSSNNMKYNMPSLNANINKSARAGSVTSIRTMAEDKIRQKDFGMI